MESYYYTVEQMQQYLHLGRTQAYSLCHEPGFPTIRVGRRILINRERLEEWLLEQEEKEELNK
ncbi:MAG: helix-turn-helix domain-containing protein [Lachnospiraceae bacterium]|nr:helix-turn-helix domain-containing protein [Lachnospiraceae bacterium]